MWHWPFKCSVHVCYSLVLRGLHALCLLWVHDGSCLLALEVCNCIWEIERAWVWMCTQLLTTIHSGWCLWNRAQPFWVMFMPPFSTEFLGNGSMSCAVSHLDLNFCQWRLSWCQHNVSHAPWITNQYFVTVSSAATLQPWPGVDVANNMQFLLMSCSSHCFFFLLFVVTCFVHAHSEFVGLIGVRRCMRYTVCRQLVVVN